VDARLSLMFLEVGAKGDTGCARQRVILTSLSRVSICSGGPMMNDVLRVRVLFFASYAELAGRDSVEVAVRAPASAGDVVRQARTLVPGAERIPERPLVALNQTHTKLSAEVADGDELALLPPMAGG